MGGPPRTNRPSRAHVLFCTFIIYFSVAAQFPMLYYNCAKMPAICRNVRQRNPLQAVPGITPVGALGLLVCVSGYGR